jgi:hypothetical protein
MFHQPAMRQLFIYVLIFWYVNHAAAQTVIFSNPGRSYNNIKTKAIDNYGPFNISGCGSIRLSVDYSFSLGWSGSGNMESADECPAIGGCAANPNAPNTGGCNNCWDFMLIELIVGGSVVASELIGGPGENQTIRQLFNYMVSRSGYNCIHQDQQSELGI